MTLRGGGVEGVMLNTMKFYDAKEWGLGPTTLSTISFFCESPPNSRTPIHQQRSLLLLVVITVKMMIGTRIIAEFFLFCLIISSSEGKHYS